MGKRQLLLVFTLGGSVEQWFASGLLDREKVIYERLLKQKVIDKVFWLTYGHNDKQFEKYLTSQIEIIPMPAIFNNKLGRLLYSWLAARMHKNKLKDVSIIKTNQMWGSWTAVSLKKVLQKLLIVRTGYTLSRNAKHWWSRLIYNFIERYAYKHASLAVVSSQNDSQYIMQKYSPQMLDCVPNFIDTNVFRPLNVRKTKDLIYVGRLSSEKNLFELISAVAKSNKTLDIYGKGAQEKSLLKYIYKLGVENRIKLKGIIANNELPKVLNKYQAYIQTSFYEGMPKTILEAMSCGLPVLGTNVRGISEVVMNGKTGLLTDTNCDSIFTGIEYLFGNQQKLLNMGITGRKKVEKEYSLTNIVAKEKKLIRELLGEKR